MVCLPPATSNNSPLSWDFIGKVGEEKSIQTFKQQICWKRKKKKTQKTFKSTNHQCCGSVPIQHYFVFFQPKNAFAVFLVIRSILTANASSRFFQKLPNFAENICINNRWFQSHHKCITTFKLTLTLRQLHSTENCESVSVRNGIYFAHFSKQIATTKMTTNAMQDYS